MGEKEEVLKWNKNAVEALRVEDDPVAGQLFYLAGKGEKPFLRSQVLKVAVDDNGSDKSLPSLEV